MKKAAIQNSNGYVAFLRGINVGGNSMIKMEDLAKEFKKLGFSNIKTILASGNVIFNSEETDTETITKTVAQRLGKILGRKISVMVRSLDDIRMIVDREPFKGVKLTSTTKTFITFIPVYTKSMNRSNPVAFDDCTILQVVDGMVVSYLHDKPGKGTLDLMSAIEKEFGNGVTTRTWNTILKVLKART